MHTICELVPDANGRAAFHALGEFPVPEAGQRLAVVFGTVDYGHVAAFPDLDGKIIQCARGNLWVTIENVPGDQVLAPGESLRIPARGKVVISGLGSYTIDHGATLGA